MRPRILAAAALAALVLSAQAAALEIGLGPAPARADVRVHSPAELASRAGPLVLPDGSRARGLSLGELAPLAAEAWRLEAKGAGGGRSWADEGLADRLYSIYLVEGSSGADSGAAPAGATGARPVAAAASWDLVVGKERLRGVESVRIEGEALAEDGLEVWLSWEGVPELKAEIARFARDHGKAVKAVEVPNTQTKLLALARAGGKLPDLVMIQSDYVPALAGGKLLQPLDYLRDADLEPKGYEAFSAEGRAWALPLYFDAQLVFYNRRLSGGDPPADWSLDDLVRRARALKGRVKAPLAWNVYSAYWLLPFMAGFGKDRIVEADGGLRVDDEATAKALRTLIALRDEGLLEPAERDAMVSWFASGEAAFILAGSYSIPEFRKLGLDFGAAPYPLAGPGGRPIAPLLDFKGLAVSRRTKAPVLARRLAEALTAQGFQARFTAALGKLPASLAAREASRGTNPYFAQLARSAETGIVVPPAPSYAVFKNIMWKLLRFLWTGQMGVEETLRTGQRLIDENLKAR